MIKKVRKSVIAGSWYPGNSSILRSEIETYFKNVPDDDIDGRVIALLSPHAGYIYSGQVAAYSYKQIIGKTYDAVIVMGPSHRTYFQGTSIYRNGGYQTPLGVVPVNEELASQIIARGKMVSFLPAAHSQEHSVEIQLPFLQVALGEFQLVPIVMGTQDPQTCIDIANAIYHAAKDRSILIVASSDLSHFYNYTVAVNLDSLVLNHVKGFKAAELLEDMERGVCEACGGGAIAATMKVSKKLGADTAKVLKYVNSGDVTGDRGSVVGYASAVFYERKNI